MKRWIWNNDLPFHVSLSRLCLIIMVLIMVFHRFIANDIPILSTSGSSWSFPVVQDYLYESGLSEHNPHMNKEGNETGIYPLVPFNPTQPDLDKILLPPGNDNYLLGTDNLGRDVFSGLIYGTATAVKVSLGAVALSLVIAIIIGVISGYYHNRPIRMNLIQLILIVILTLLNLCYLFTEMFSHHFNVVMILLSLSVSIILWLLVGQRISRMNIRKFSIPIHQFTDRIIEVREAIPTIFLILGAIALFKDNSVWNVALVIGIIGWGGLSRYVRAEVIRVREKSYIDAVIIQGKHPINIIIKHVLPNALDPLLSIITFSFTAAILLEATLSFLGVGMPPDAPTWGSLLAQARTANAWWLAIFPGLCIFIAIASLNSVADYLQGRLDVRIKS